MAEEHLIEVSMITLAENSPTVILFLDLIQHYYPHFSLEHKRRLLLNSPRTANPDLFNPALVYDTRNGTLGCFGTPNLYLAFTEACSYLRSAIKKSLCTGQDASEKEIISCSEDIKKFPSHKINLAIRELEAAAKNRFGVKPAQLPAAERANQGNLVRLLAATAPKSEVGISQKRKRPGLKTDKRNQHAK